jgi:aminoglycoside/choline kinase family phosphotransferase
MPRVWALIARHLGHPALAPVADWYRRYLPPADRKVLSPDQARSMS